MRLGNCLLIFLSLFGLGSCAYNSTFFPVEKQNLNAEFIDLDYEEIRFKSDDNHTIYSVLFTQDKKSRGTIFFLPGSGDNIASWSANAEHLINGGYQVYMMEYRGFGGSRGKATHSNVVSDAENGLFKLIEQSEEKDKKIILLGQSYGGQIAINLASKHPDKVAALITEGTFTSFNQEVVYSVPFLLKPFLAIFTVSPYKSKDLIKEIRDVPVLIIHSKEDTVVPYKMGQKLFANANQPKYFWEIRGDHVKGIDGYTNDYLEKIGLLLGAAPVQSH